MRRAAVGSALFLIVAPGVAAGLVPWLLTGWDAAADVPLALVVAGFVLVAAGVAVLLHAFARFVVEGIGTPAPVAPPEQTRGRRPVPLRPQPDVPRRGGDDRRAGADPRPPALLLYALAFGAAVWTFVHVYEEPTLARRFGAEYEAYRHAVPGWWPRRRPWSPSRG